MSYSLAVVDGDLALNGNALGIVYGVDKLKQDIDLWIRERFGIDRFHPAMGSTLEEFIGSIVSASTKAEIYSEVLRILENYQNIQYSILKRNPQKLSPTEIMLSINSVDVSVNYDTVYVTVSVSNAVGQQTLIRASASA